MNEGNDLHNSQKTEQRASSNGAPESVTEEHYKAIFENSPVSLWEEDFSEVKAFLAELRESGVTDIEAYCETHPNILAQCFTLVQVRDINLATLDLYEAKSKEELLHNRHRVFTEECHDVFKEEIFALASGKTTFRGEGPNYTLTGKRLHVSVQLTVAPGSEETWDRVFIAISDLTGQKQTEEMLRLDEARFEALLTLNQMEDAPLKELTDFALEKAIELTGSLAGYLAFTNEDESSLTLYSWFLDTSQVGVISETPRTFSLERGGPWKRAIRERRPIIINDFSESASLKNRVPSHHVKITRYMSVPVFDGERIVAIAGIGNKTLDYDDADLRQINLLMQGMWNLIRRKRTSDALQQSEALYRTLFEEARDAIFLENDSERIIDANPQASILSGYSRQELLSMHTSDLQPREWRMEGVATEGRFETRLLRKDGTQIPVDITVSPLLEDEDQRYLSIVRDITPRVEAENRLKESQRTLTTLMSNLPGMAYRCRNDEEWTMEFISEGCKALTGYDSADLELNRSVSYVSLIHPDDRKMVRDVVQQGVHSHTPFTVVYRITTAEGMQKWVWEQGQAIYAEDGKRASLEGFISDITESRQATDALSESERRFRGLFEDSPIALYEQDFSGVKQFLDELRFRGVTDFQAHFEQNPHDVAHCASLIRVLDVNRVALEMYGARDRRELVDNLDRIITGETHSGFQRQLIAFAHGSTVFSGESVNRSLDGQIVPIYLKWAIAPGYEDTWERVFVSIMDMTERVRAEQAQHESEQLMQRTLASLTDAVFILDEHVEVIECNPAASRIFGYAREEMLGTTGSLLHVNERNHEQFKELIYRATSEGRILENVEFPMRRKDGTIFPSERSLIPLEDETGQTIGWVAVARDLTERKRMEQELLKVEKLESVGVLAGGIAHDFNNLLTGILGNIALAKLYLPSTSEIHEILTEAEAASLRAKDLTHQLLTFSKGGAPIMRTSAISDLLRDTTTFALRGSNVRSRFEMADDLWHVEVDENQFSQVIHNLALNADQAMPDGGELIVSAHNTIIEPDSGMPLPAGRYIQIAITDEGVGIPAEILNRIFDPYFTTKQKGSGLGLATVYSIIKAHGGHVTVESEIGAGSTFLVYLPASSAAIEIDAPISAAAQSIPRARILIMDDEEVVRKTASSILGRLGHDIEEARDGRETIERYRNAMHAGRPFDIVIMDLTVPGGMGGKEAISRLQEIDPNVKAIVSSGYSTDPVLAQFADYGFRGMVNKPYAIDDLIQTLREALMDSNG